LPHSYALVTRTPACTRTPSTRCLLSPTTHTERFFGKFLPNPFPSFVRVPPSSPSFLPSTANGQVEVERAAAAEAESAGQTQPSQIGLRASKPLSPYLPARPGPVRLAFYFFFAPAPSPPRRASSLLAHWLIYPKTRREKGEGRREKGGSKAPLLFSSSSPFVDSLVCCRADFSDALQSNVSDRAAVLVARAALARDTFTHARKIFFHLPFSFCQFCLCARTRRLGLEAALGPGRHSGLGTPYHRAGKEGRKNNQSRQRSEEKEDEEREREKKRKRERERGRECKRQLTR
jgi:hypothetical protein